MLREIVLPDETQFKQIPKNILFFVIPEMNLLNEAQRLKKKTSKDYHIQRSANTRSKFIQV